MPYLRLTRAESDGDADAPLTFTASTPGVKRDGLDLAALPWRTANFERNPVVTWSHDFAGNRLPIGRAEVSIIDDADERATRQKGEVLSAAITFDREDPFAAEVERKYRNGFLHAISVSWDDVDDSGVPVRGSGKAVAHELLEIAAVPVPGDPAALLERQRSALRELVRELDAVADDDDTGDDAVERAADDTPDVPATPEQALAAMVRAFDRGDDVDDDERRRRYNWAEVGYRRLGMVAPEWLTGDDLRALDDDAWRGMWLEGEIVCARAGAVLSRRNLARLESAIDALMDIRNEAAREDDDERAVDRDDVDDTQDDTQDDTLEALERLRAALFGDSDNG